jgi:hypothetical protein
LTSSNVIFGRRLNRSSPIQSVRRRSGSHWRRFAVATLRGGDDGVTDIAHRLHRRLELLGAPPLLQRVPARRVDLLPRGEPADQRAGVPTRADEVDVSEAPCCLDIEELAAGVVSGGT